eukprot:TRINITY_DN4985_c0_g1_i3.p1 TRINITY_DN4985_c0_g1~~TRINITY_DN4985_c0_g1_i3.p1  ORF type:complete len:315 (-),score=58.42 TRINITY_DN4985_c0_g1_i3:562-1506(-)
MPNKKKTEALALKQARRKGLKGLPVLQSSRVLHRGASALHGVELCGSLLLCTAYQPPESDVHDMQHFLRVWSTDNWKYCTSTPARCAVPVPALCSAALSVDWRARFVAVGDGDTARVLDIRRWTTVCGIEHNSTVRAVCFSPSGDTLATAAGTRVQLWNTAVFQDTREPVLLGVLARHEAEEPIVLDGHTAEVLCVGFCAGGKVLSGSEDCTVKVWSQLGEATWWCEATLRGHQGPVRCVAAHEHTLASGSKDCTVRVWERGVSVSTLCGHTDRVSDCRFSGTGRLLVSASKDRSIRVWDAASFKCVGLLTGHK